MPMEKKRKKIRIPALLASILLTFLLLAAPIPAAALYDLPADTTVNAASVMLVSLGATPAEDMPLFERKADSKRSPAALVRLMVGATAVKIIRDKGIDIDKTTGTYNSTAFNVIAGSGLGTAMSLGEVWTVRDLLSISMIQTAADACATLAITLVGSHTQFVAEMNALAKEMGCQNTSFANVTGKDSANQYTTARDIVRIIRYAMDYPEFEPLFAASEYTCKPVSGGKQRSYANTNDMLRSTKAYYYSPMAFGKTGWTSPAGRCLASVARDSGYEYLCVVLGSPESDATSHYADTRTLYKWAFNNFTYKTLLNKNEPITQLPVRLVWNRDSVTLVPETSFAATVANDLDPSTILKKTTLIADSVNAPVTKGQVCGKIELFINIDQKIGEVNLVASQSVERSDLLAVWDQIQSFLSSPWFYVALGLLFLLLIGYIILNIIHNRQRRRNRMKRVKRYR